VLVIGCGNLLRGDDAAGPMLVRRMWDRGLPDGVRCVDGGTGGMDVVFQMRGVRQVILVDAGSSGSEPGTLFEVPGHEVENIAPLTGINLHAFRWDHAIAFGRWLLKDDYPENVTAYLIEGERYEIGEGLSPAVDKAVDRLVDLLLEKLGPEPAEAAGRMMHDLNRSPAASPAPETEPPADVVQIPLPSEGHVGLPLERALCDVEAGTITCPWHGFRFDSDTGECLSAPQCQLEPFPLRVTAGVVWVKPS